MFAKTFVALSLAASALAQFSVNSPTLVQCQPALVQWTGSTNSPFTLAIIPGGQPTSPAIEFVSDALNTSPYTWIVNLATGTNVTLRLTDSTGAIAYSAPAVIQAGASNSCLNASASTAGVATTAAVTTTNTASVTASDSRTVSGASTSTTSVMASSMASSMASMASSAASRSAAASGNAASSVASGAGAATSAAASAAASAATGAGYASAVVGVPAILLGLAGFAVLA